MVNYQNGKIYKIVSNHTDKVYYGSTANTLHQRMGLHRSKYNTGTLECSSREIMVYPDRKIILVEAYPCNNIHELKSRERWWIENNNCVNKQIPTRTTKEWVEVNKDKCKIKWREYRENNQEEIRRKCKEWRDANKDKRQQRSKEYYKTNCDVIKTRVNEYTKKNKEIINEKKRQYHQKNKEKINEKRREKVFCECGTYTTRSTKLQHERSMKHEKQINELLALFE
jgi:hypothetical protein